jgi:hypothetical protein
MGSVDLSLSGELGLKVCQADPVSNLCENRVWFADQLINLDDVDGDEDMRPEFSCPYCDEDFDITSLCSHLENEHCFESKPAVSFSLSICNA